MNEREELFIAIFENASMTFLIVALTICKEPLSIPCRIVLDILVIIECYYFMELRKAIRRYIVWRKRRNKRGR